MEYSDPKWHWNAPFATPEATKFLREEPPTPLERGCFLCCSLYKHVHAPPVCFQTFWSKPIFIHVILLYSLLFGQIDVNLVIATAGDDPHSAILSQMCPTLRPRNLLQNSPVSIIREDNPSHSTQTNGS